MGSIFSQFIVFIFSSIPLYFALKMIKEKAKKISFTKVFLVTILVAAVASAVSSSFGFLGGVVAFILALFVYKEMFEIDWLTAFLVWLMQIVIVALVFWAFILLGISLIFL
ncbi:MAG: hypothetical protein ABIF85_01985 [Nanoarchaeota archaeon]|nr:hypothetical protein [Nanoarchaeota archaeon]MBU4300885.1 hypothetical protein [Nanoarchaeota archaeon]MBU4451409.1 hypothetical protein [Nanoarchaeota archaeon]MCG2724517.1 hypothetical protein [archaeon]